MQLDMKLSDFLRLAHDPEQHDHDVAVRVEAWRPDFELKTTEDERLFQEMVAASVRVDHAQRNEFAVRSYLGYRASVSWEADRRRAAAELARQLSRAPSLTVCRLEATRQGAEWLINAWRGLAAMLEENATWDETQTARACDLLGVPLEFRDGDFTRRFGPPAEVAAREIARLETFRTEALVPLDERERQACMAGVELEPNRFLNAIRRHEAAQFRRFKLIQGRLRSSPRPLAAAAETAPSPVVPIVAPAPRSLPPATPPPAEPEPVDSDSISPFSELLARLIRDDFKQMANANADEATDGHEAATPNRQDDPCEGVPAELDFTPSLARLHPRVAPAAAAPQAGSSGYSSMNRRQRRAAEKRARCGR